MRDPHTGKLNQLTVNPDCKLAVRRDSLSGLNFHPRKSYDQSCSEELFGMVVQDSGHSLGAGGPLTKFKRQMSLTTKGCITPSGMEEQLRSPTC